MEIGDAHKRRLGETVRDAERIAAQVEAVAMDEGTFNIFLKIVATNRVTAEDLAQLQHRGIALAFTDTVTAERDDLRRRLGKVETLAEEWEREWDDAVDRGVPLTGFAVRRGAAKRLRAALRPDA
ncbi:hypothetical protein [Nocardioides alcanivorans]|uniref:hypothetical protein n=1 Tax=Nocardioides alcanivorans TaxID=2897352 RepID=UPI001F24CF0D|nr:hypothetical protein [Nocardioides alcanivorans]